VAHEMNEDFPEFESEDELRDWFDNADLSAVPMDEALEVVVASQVRLIVGDDQLLSTSSGTTGSLREPVGLHIVPTS
jgi:hypothetical protein